MQKRMYRTLALRLIGALSRQKFLQPSYHMGDHELPEDEPILELGIACRKRPSEIHVDEEDALIESGNDNLSPMAERLIVSPFDHPSAESKRMKQSGHETT